MEASVAFTMACLDSVEMGCDDEHEPCEYHHGFMDGYNVALEHISSLGDSDVWKLLDWHKHPENCTEVELFEMLGLM